jgi:peptidoglycan/LPS O-acetylase OafA/YrhL
VYYIGEIGNILFFAVSGYLAANSLEHSKSTLEFYRRKLIRVVVPFTTAYIFLSVLFLLLAILNPQFPQNPVLNSPLNDIAHSGGHFVAFFVGMFPIDVNLLRFFNIASYLFVGEWFIGTIIFLYLISPLLYKCICRNAFIISVASMIIAYLVFNLTEDWAEKGYIIERNFIFLVRMPQFLIGMLLFMYKDYILNYLGNLTKLFLILLMGLVAYGIYFYPNLQSLWQKILFGYPANILQYCFASVVFVYLIYILTIFSNEHFPNIMAHFNEFSGVSYMAMLIHHPIIYRLNDIYNFSDLSRFGTLFFFLLVVFITVF